MKSLSPYNLLSVVVIQSTIDGTSQSFGLLWLFCCIYLAMSYQLIVSFSIALGLVYVQCSSFWLDVPNTRRVSFHYFQSFFHVPCLLYTALYLQRTVCFLQPILLLTLSKYCWIVWHTLTLLAFWTQTLFLYALNITCICHILLILYLFPCSCFYRLLL